MISTACAALALATLGAPGGRADPVSDVNTLGGVALHGFDPVAYFAQSKAVLGKPQLTAIHRGVTYEFASKEDQTAFQANPEKYVPQFGGFCAFATSVGVKADADPHEFVVSNGKLYVNNNEQAQKLFQQDVAGNIVKADHNWPDVVKLPMR
jgi:YHS domain-containing protein